MTTFFTSDLHFGHEFVASLRGWRVPRNHDKELIAAWNEHVREGDEVWVLGDLSLKNSRFVAQQLLQLNGTIHVVLGNHDRAHPMWRGWQNQWSLLAGLPNVGFVGTEAVLHINGKTVRLSHFPTVADHTEEHRFDEWRPRLREGELLLHGHTHSDVAFTSPRELHVGWDAWDRPIPMNMVEGWFESQ